jgi:DNA polymerase-3 subunit gamma/tau
VEEIPFEEPALWLLARAADGSMRDALSLTDQAIAFGNQTLSASDVGNMLGTIDQRDIERIVNALVEGDGPALLAEVSRISDFAPDYSVILADLLSLFHRVTMEQVVPGSADNALGDAGQVQALARRLSAEDAQLFYQSALIGRKDLTITPDARMGFEMTLLRMLAFRPGADRREPPAISSGGKTATSEPRDEPDPAPTRPIKPDPPEPEPAQPETEVRPEPRPEAKPEPELEPEPEPEPEPPADLTVEAEDEFVWHRDFRSLGIVGMPANLASHGAMSRDGDVITLTIDEGHARLLNSRHEEKILAALRNRFGDAIQVRIQQGNPGPQTPAAYEEQQRRARQETAETSIRQDPLVKSIVERFEARVVEESIRPAETRPETSRR